MNFHTFQYITHLHINRIKTEGRGGVGLGKVGKNMKVGKKAGTFLKDDVVISAEPFFELFNMTAYKFNHFVV